MKKIFYRMTRFCILLSCFFILPLNADRYGLPDISDPSYTTLSYAAEKKLGRIILAEVRSQLPIVEDIEIQSYLRYLGEKILTRNEEHTLDFHFLVVKNAAINAFATPGGVLAFNDGLILSTENESELGGVIAHEIAHVTHRHLARLEALSKGSSLMTTLAVIGAIIASTYNSELAELSLFGSAALPLEKRLVYTRNFEYEADRFGMQLMVNAGLDPSGMSAFFGKLQKQESRGIQIEFLRSHPLTVSRLSDAQARAMQYRGTFAKDSKAFRYMKARLLALKRITTTKHADKNIANYYHALHSLERLLPEQALGYLEKITDDEQHAVAIQLAFAHAYRVMGNWDKAIILLNELNDLHPGRPSILYYLALCLLKDEQPQKALEQINSISRLHKYYPQFYKLGAQATTRIGRHVEYHEYLADYYAAEGHIEAALHQLDLAEKNEPLHQSINARITAKRRDLEELRKGH